MTEEKEQSEIYKAMIQYNVGNQKPLYRIMVKKLRELKKNADKGEFGYLKVTYEYTK